MTEIMASQGFKLSAPPSRQDVISALLTEYGNSFGRGDASPSAFSPLPIDKELPLPPRSDSLANKPLPAVQRAEQRMSMKFQLRVIEDGPFSPNSLRTATPEQRSRRKIPFRSLSRDGKPPSLNLVTSNGSTAIVPPTPLPSQSFPVPSNIDTKDLPSPPPPPPVKSERRSNAQRAPMGLQQSKSQRELARNDSLLSQSENERPQTETQAAPNDVPAVKRKALPAPAAKKFMSLAALGTGPRGGKGGPLPPTSAPRTKSVESRAPDAQGEILQTKEAESTVQVEGQPRDAPTLGQMPPTPEEDNTTTSAPVPPRKTFVPLGLPSNPRAKGGPISPLHVRGKSSTGFNLLKAQRPAPPIPSMRVETLTPEMTPSPTLMPKMLSEHEMSPVSPLPPPSDQKRPFSFEPISAPKPPPKAEEVPAKLTAPIIAPSKSVPPAQPIRPTSLDLSELSPELRPSSAPAPASQPETTAALPISNEPASPIKPTPTPPPFTSLTRAPIPLPQVLIPAITTAHLACYTAHKNNIWSNNTFQPMGCMICRENDRERKWCCTWCQLRICRGCSEELSMVPGKNLGVYLKERERTRNEGTDMSNPGMMLNAVDERDEDFS